MKKLSLLLMALLLFVFFFRLEEKKPSDILIPECDRLMPRIFLSFDTKAVDKNDILKENFQKILAKFNKNTDIFIFTSSQKRQMLGLEGIQNLNFIDVQSINFWMQDNFEMVNNDTIIIPNEDFYVKNYQLSYKTLRTFFKKVIKTNFYFEGGNMILAKVPSGKNTIFLGYGVIEKTAQQIYKEQYQSQKNDINKVIERQIRDFFTKKLKVKVIFLGKQLESIDLIHIDQAILFLDKDNVILMDHEGTQFPEVKAQLKIYEKQLKALGFNIVKLKHSDEDIVEKKFSLNSIIYKNADNEKSIIFPVYPNEHQENILKGKALKLKAIFDSFGFKSQSFFDDIFYQFGGSSHCLVNY